MNESIRKIFTGGAVAVSTMACLTGISPAAEPLQMRETHPNLIIVFPDQMRGQAMGFLNEDPVVTPHLDRFAKEGLVLRQMVSNYPVCSPFRAMLMTGRYPVANRVLANCNSRTEPSGCELQKTDRCWSDVLKDEGYSLGYIGKWHLDSPREPYIRCSNNQGPKKWNEWCSPDRRHGFDFWYSYGTYDEHMNPMYWRTDAGRDEFHFVQQWGPEHEADQAIEYIHNSNGEWRRPGRPFALVVSMNPPHTPYDSFPDHYLDPYRGKSPEELLVRPNVDKTGTSEMSRRALSQTKNYFANITGVDEQFGRILHAVDEAGLRDNTIVLFTSDHGDCVGTHNQITKNNPFEESMRIPFIIRWPGRIRPQQDSLLMSVPDIYPTLLGLMGLEKRIPASVQGTNYAGLFLNGTGWRPSSQLYLKIPHDKPAYGVRGVRTHQYKLIVTAGVNEPVKRVLYDLQSDPYELKDIATNHPGLVRQLIRTELVPWLEKTNDPWIKNIKKFQTARQES